MPRARTTESNWQTAAAEEDSSSGCFSTFLLPPFAVLIVGFMLAWLALHANAVQASSPAAGIQPASIAALSPVFTPEIQHWSDFIVQWAAASRVDPNLAATVMQIESCGDPRAVSSAGAIGLFQVMPYHFQLIDNPYDPATNAERGLAYLARALAAANGDARLALAGYNGGIGVIGRSEWTWSAETQRYVQFGWPIYSDAHSGALTSNAAQEWYLHYGAGMCRRAHQRLGLL